MERKMGGIVSLIPFRHDNASAHISHKTKTAIHDFDKMRRSDRNYYPIMTTLWVREDLLEPW